VPPPSTSDGFLARVNAGIFLPDAAPVSTACTARALAPRRADRDLHYHPVIVHAPASPVMSTAPVPRAPLPPFDAVAAARKVRLAEDAWNTRDPARVALAYSPDSAWRNRAEFVHGRAAIVAFLERKWQRELDYRLVKELWAWQADRIAVRFAYEWHDDSGNWFRSYGNENWAFDAAGYMVRRIASINDLPITAGQRLFHWPLGRRPDDHPGLSALGL
jgi:nuclear transport factor 2 (NTF2) superfamily protein